MRNLFMLLIAVIVLASCERVELNHAGVLMENFGKSGKEDFTIVQGRVSTMAPGTELFQVPLWEQRAGFDSVMHLQAADKTAFTVLPSYSYQVIKERAIDVIFNNKHLGSGNDFMKELEYNVLEPRIYDITKDASRSFSTDVLMAEGGSLKFEKGVRGDVEKSFEENGLKLITFTAQLNFSNKVTEKIDQRNEVDQNISVINKEIAEWDRRIELAKRKRDYNKIMSEGITDELLQQQFIEKWDGKTPLYQLPVTLFKNIQ